MKTPIYTIGIQRWPLPFFKRYQVGFHEVEVLGTSVRAVLFCADGSVIVVPRLDRKKLKIYPDYRTAQKLRELATAVDLPDEVAILEG